ncbi:MAG: thioredoxin [Fibrobacterota bacterium]|jgi:rhodanese-related sulfurtransferase
MSFLKTLFSLLSGGDSGSRLAPEAFKLALDESPRPVLVDVRTASEFKGGHIKGARNIDITSSSFDKGIASLAKDKPVLLYCRSSHRSGMALSRMKASGFTQVRHLEGGISAWQARNYSTAR